MNRIMKEKNIIISLLFLILAFTACEDHLDKQPLGELSPENFYSTAEGAEAGVNAAYSYLRHYDLVGLPFIAGGDIASDDSDPGNKNNKASIEFDEFTFSPSSSLMTNWYSGQYVLIGRANIVINSESEFVFEEDLQKRILAEAKFMRAYGYFNLVKSFGGVPKITVLPELDGDFIPRATPEEIWQLIDEDLEYAITYLPERSEYSPANLGRVTKGAARGLLARAFLFRNDFEKVERYAMEIINSNEYTLFPDYEGIFTYDGENCSESVFEVQATRSESGNKTGTDKYNTVQGSKAKYWDPEQGKFINNQGLGWGINSPSDDLEAAYEDGDPRKDATIAYVGDTLYDGRSIVVRNSKNHGTKYNQKGILPLFYDGTDNKVTGGGGGANNPANVRLIRYADVLLMAAEALNENDKPTDALVYLNMVRERARGDNPDILPNVTTTDKLGLRNAIWHERRVELAMEQNRYWDILRQGRAAELLQALGKNFVEGKHNLLPIPQVDVDATEGVITQNPGY
ncbi:RagB/SusD family nutrient uptake outer membrane protein [Marinifilum breve]|uniref:RagB/SusD family nutrient uptake outer membrane protein n=1 Tax=Marinifilum breve TaxID=2184082 RepID=A0A2V4A6Z3_9BACT|nr:RagB/SusD family nutrient uptake outer membrane protein [Marinifilum breve]PXY03140.1 RagB/SusD family nutrient uptake outer membrane protein [Marinifilum breve]